ncbi:IS110 family transposase [Streptomyces sp. BPTC-684]|uniref:IS110 family transposase n=1 Tax=Streptomyces sp. BPTC-684 TaxID=3043734 RepID=UPI0024B251D1|nr:IS110 family transposase [Streptomyces sp. BPTC-684]WHM40876.1 IS110 family transposase [Streptomyces sp. BPTC-684]
MGDETIVTELDPSGELVARVGALDIAKASAMLCTRVPGSGKRKRQEVRKTGATTAAILELADHLVCQGIELVVMESTSDYWRPFYYLLEDRGLQCWLVNARDVKNVPGRPKTDKLDAVWLAKLAERGMLRRSFVPPEPVRRLRDLTRARAVLAEDRTAFKERIEKVLEDAQIKLSTVAADIFGVSGRSMLDALIAGERSPNTLADLARGSMRAKKADLAQALRGRFDGHHAYLIRLYLDNVDRLDTQIADLTAHIEAALTALAPAPRTDPAPDGTVRMTLLDRLTEIPGIGRVSAQNILAETGFDMNVFPSPGHLASWAKLTPRTIQSGAKNTTAGTGKGNPWLRRALGQAAVSAGKSQSFLGSRYRRLVKRKPRKKAQVAIARNILEIVWYLVNDPDARYIDLGPDWYDRRTDPERKTRDLVRQLERLGNTVTLTPASA